MNKAQGLSLNVVIIAALVLLALIITVALLMKKFGFVDQQSYCDEHPDDSNSCIRYGCTESISGNYICKRNCTNSSPYYYVNEFVEYYSFDGHDVPVGKCDTFGLFNDLSRKNYDEYIRRIESRCDGKLTVYVGGYGSCEGARPRGDDE